MPGLSWDLKLTALNTAIASSSAYVQSLGAAVGARLTRAGTTFDIAFPGGSEGLSIETSDHSAWRSAHAAAQIKVNTFLATLDSGPSGSTLPNVPGHASDEPDTLTITSAKPTATMGALSYRAQNVVQKHPNVAALVHDMLASLPQEPSYHPGKYAQPWTRTGDTKPTGTYGAVEDALRAVLADADSVIALA
jgi:hypothetical protein